MDSFRSSRIRRNGRGRLGVRGIALYAIERGPRMATTLKTLRWADLAVGISIFVLAALTGCAGPRPMPAPTATMSDPSAMHRTAITRIPAPSFDGPNVLTKAAAGAARAQASVSTASGPAAWKPRVPARDWKWIVIHHSA